MKRMLICILSLLLWTAPALAQVDAVPETAGALFTGTIKMGGWFVWPDKNAGMAGESEYLHGSGAAALDVRWVSLPHRGEIISEYNNQKDYFADMDYAWRDIVVVNVLARGLYRNLEHKSIGMDDPATVLPSFTDRDPGDVYGAGWSSSRVFLRLKTPDFPFHLFAEFRDVEWEGTLQQRFQHANNLIPPAKISQSRSVETRGTEYAVGANSHLGPVEVQFAHTGQAFDAKSGKTMYDAYLVGTNSFEHNRIPELESSQTSLKLHSSYSGRLVVAGSYVSGDRKSVDGKAKADYSVAAGDITWIPVNELAVFIRYRHYENELTNPGTVTSTAIAGPVTYNVRKSISTSRDVVTGILRYQFTDTISARAEYGVEAFDREVGLRNTNLTAPPAGIAASWSVPTETTKGTAKLGINYRPVKTLMVRAEYSHLTVDVPAYATDPDSGNYGRLTATWAPGKGFSAMIGAGTAVEKRDLDPNGTTANTREASRSQGFGSVTTAVGRRSTVTVSYGYFKNKVEQGIIFRDGAGNPVLDRGVPYSDTAQTGTLSFGHSPMDSVFLTAEVSRTYSKGGYATSGTVAGSDGIDDLSDLRVTEGEYQISAVVEVTKQTGYELRYAVKEYDDKNDNSLDGSVKTMVALLSVKW